MKNILSMQDTFHWIWYFVSWSLLIGQYLNLVTKNRLLSHAIIGNLYPMCEVCYHLDTPHKMCCSPKRNVGLLQRLLSTSLKYVSGMRMIIFMKWNWFFFCFHRWSIRSLVQYHFRSLDKLTVSLCIITLGGGILNYRKRKFFIQKVHGPNT